MQQEPSRSQRVALPGWRRVEALTLIATIPAFYLAILSELRLVSSALYLCACVISAWVIWRERMLMQREPQSRTMASRHGVGLLLVATLLLSAVLPQGDGAVALGVRSAAALLILLRWGESLRPWFWRGSLPHLLALAVGVLGLCGAGFWWLEPRARTFGDGLWLAFTTAATVGYGDIVPSTPAAKIFAVFVVLMGFAVLSLVTASIAAMWVQTEERRIEREILQDIHRQIQNLHHEIAALRREQQASERQTM
jgi:voltage-gated potassium channel